MFSNKYKLSIIFPAFFWSLFAYPQEPVPFPQDVPLITLAGDTISSRQLKSSTPYTLFDFWSYGCKPCIVQLNTFAEEYDAMLAKGIRVVAIAIFPLDDRISQKLLAKSNWPFEIYYDYTGKLFKKYSPLSADIPLSVLFDRNWKKILKQRGAPIWYKTLDGRLIDDTERKFMIYDSDSLQKLSSSPDHYYEAVEAYEKKQKNRPDKH